MLDHRDCDPVSSRRCGLAGCGFLMLPWWSGFVVFFVLAFGCRASVCWVGRRLSWWRGCRVLWLCCCVFQKATTLLWCVVVCLVLVTSFWLSADARRGGRQIPAVISSETGFLHIVSVSSARVALSLSELTRASSAWIVGRRLSSSWACVVGVVVVSAWTVIATCLD